MTPQEYALQRAGERAALLSRELPQGIGGRLMMLEQSKKIALGISPNMAFTAWTKMTGIGILCGSLGTLLMIWIPISFFWLGWKAALISLIICIFYSILVRSISRAWFRKRLLIYTHEFHELYCMGHATLRIASTGEIVHEPTDWISRIQNLA